MQKESCRTIGKPQIPGVMRKSSFRAIVTGVLFSSFFFALSLAVAPQLHERIHPNATKSDHECAVTLIASGKYEQSDAAPALIVPQAALPFCKIPALCPIWVESPFLGASIFEHAPPALA